ncbi:MAG: prolipoprotein diacylglyceryl transferase [Anaerolineales bacterium]|jgi:phosphatidylglycerol:prolipoprotein diacylglycerol transferase
MGIQIGRFTIYYYGIIIMFGALAAAGLAAYEAKRKGQSSDIVWDGLVWVLIGGILGARIWHILTPPASMAEAGYTTMYYLTHPLDAINIRAGGLGIPGAVIGGLLALFIFARRRQLNFLFWLDIVAPALALGQAIGRWGNFFNQELYGRPSTLPWAIQINPENRLPGYEDQATYHPLFLYESLWNFGIVILLLWLGRKYDRWLKDGDLFLVYLIAYPLGRFLLEFLRLDPSRVGGININQTVMMIVALSALVLLVLRHWRKTKSEPATVGEED